MSDAAPTEFSSARGALAVDAGTLVRGVLFLAVYLLVFISLHPFTDLSEPPPDVSDGGDRSNQIVFTLVFVLLGAWTYTNGIGRLKLLLRPALIVTLAWCALSVVTSWEPMLAARRVVFMLVIMGIAGMALLLPKGLRQFSDLMAAAALIVLAACYLGLLLVPSLAMHQLTDFLEAEHAGSWRGVFAHKNEAGAAMVLFVFIGLFVARMRSLVLGGSIVALASMFLVFSHSKTALGMLPLVLVVSAIVARARRPAVGIAIAVGIAVAINLFSIGSILFEPVHSLVEQVMPDPSFTGRTDIWRFALEHLAERPITGYGFSAFWGTEPVVYAMDQTWATAAADAHNAYLNLAVTIGIPGLALVILWVIILPLVDYCGQPKDAHTRPLQTLFLRMCLFAAYTSCFESAILQQANMVWFMGLTAAFGLRYLAHSRVAL
ncbi:MAG TPA: O-antigen ligase [Xanthobacteraceae bacterium]